MHGETVKLMVTLIYVADCVFLIMACNRNTPEMGKDHGIAQVSLFNLYLNEQKINSLTLFCCWLQCGHAEKLHLPPAHSRKDIEFYCFTHLYFHSSF